MDRKKRIMEKEGGWYFLTREGQVGPHPSEDDAKLALSRYLVQVQLDLGKDMGPEINLG